MKHAICIIIFSLYTFHFLNAQQISKKQDINSIKNGSKKLESSQAVEGDVIFTDGTNQLLRITDEGTSGAIQLSDGVPSNTDFKLYRNGTNLFFGTANLSIEGNAVDSLNQLTDAKYDGESLYIGAGAGINDDSGLSDGSKNFNIGIGKSTLSTNISGNRNVAIGNESQFFNVNGNRNTTLGSESMYNNFSGNANVALGLKSNYFNETGENNTLVGTRAGYGSTGNSFSGNVFIGYQAGYNEISSDKLYIENSDSDTPLIWGDFEADSIKITGKLETTGRINTSRIQIRAGASEGYTLTSDSEGKATWQTPQKIGFSSHLASNRQEYLYITEDNLLNYLVEDYDEGDVFNPTNGEFTAPSDGFYHLDVNFTWLVYSDFRGTIKMKKNGQVFTGSVYESHVEPTHDSHTTFSFSVNTQLQSNDEITVWYDAYDSTSPTGGGVIDLAPHIVAGGNTDYTSTFSGFKIH